MQMYLFHVTLTVQVKYNNCIIIIIVIIIIEHF